MDSEHQIDGPPPTYRLDGSTPVIMVTHGAHRAILTTDVTIGVEDLPAAPSVRRARTALTLRHRDGHLAAILPLPDDDWIAAIDRSDRVTVIADLNRWTVPTRR